MYIHLHLFCGIYVPLAQCVCVCEELTLLLVSTVHLSNIVIYQRHCMLHTVCVHTYVSMDYYTVYVYPCRCVCTYVQRCTLVSTCVQLCVDACSGVYSMHVQWCLCAYQLCLQCIQWCQCVYSGVYVSTHSQNCLCSCYSVMLCGLCC